MRLFRRTNSIRQTLDARHAAETSDIDLRTSDAALVLNVETVHPDWEDAHDDLDELEERLARIQKQQLAYADASASSTRKGSVVQLDLRTLIQLADDDDEDFDKRFDEFASADTDDHARRWMEG